MHCLHWVCILNFSTSVFLQVGTRIKAKVGLGSRDTMARPATGGGARARPGGSMTAPAIMRRGESYHSFIATDK